MTAEADRLTSGTAPRAGRYHLDSRIATGGMGEVWRATDTVLDREVAVKVLRSEYADDPAFRTRFQAEARLAAALHHPHVASVFDFGELPVEDPTGTPGLFLVMEMVPGRPLSALLRGEPMPPATAADLVAQAADAIAAAHAMGIVHRDVKPANLLVTPQAQVKITDFGIARAADAVALTQAGQILGTPHYMSPEQAAGRTATAASDIYALGVVLYECLAGHRPFAGGSPVTIALAHLRDPVPPLPRSIPDHLRVVVDRALAKEPADRFGSASDMASALRGGAVGSAAMVPAPAPTQVLRAPTAAVPPTGAPARRPGLPPWWPWVASAAGLLLVAALAAFLGSGDADRTAADNAAAAQGVQTNDGRVRVWQAFFVGMDHDAAKDRLERRGFDVNEEDRDNPGGHDSDTVAAVSPHGLVDPQSSITLVVWSEAPEDQHGDHEKGPSDKGQEHGKRGEG